MTPVDDGPTSPSPFASFARLYAPAAGGGETRLIEAGDAWNAEELHGLGAAPAIWGNLSTHGGGPIGAAIRHAVRRERALRRLRRVEGAVAVHRLAPSARSDRLRPAIRGALRSGLLVEINARGRERVVDLVLRDAGAPPGPSVHLRPRADGSALAMFRATSGEAVVLRVTTANPTAIRENAAGLAALESASVPDVPRLRGQGRTAGAEWTTETRLAGRIPPRIESSVLDATVAFCGALPRQARATSLDERLLRLAGRHDRWATLLRAMAGSRPSLPGILQHGDLWLRNLLVEREGLSGVIDWETWHPSGVPGADLLQLVAMDRRRRARQGIGALWASGVWRSDEFVGLATPYWRRLGIDVDEPLLEAVGLDWWAGQVLRHERLSGSADWVRDNVDRVLRTFGDPT